MSVRTICPAVILAANRNDRVIGWTNTLIVSVSTRNGLSHVGAPSGRKWAIVFLGCLVSLERIINIHIGRPIDKVIIKCLVFLRVYGVIPRRLDRMIVIKIVETIADIPFIWVEYVRDSWEKIVDIIGISLTEARFIDGHIDRLRNKMIISEISRSGVRAGITEEYTYGSNVEKMSFIIKI